MRKAFITIVFVLACSVAHAGPEIFMLAAQKCSAPGVVTQNTLTNNPPQLVTSWNTVSGATSYKVYYSTSSSLNGSTYDGSNAYPGTPSATAGIYSGNTGTSYTIFGPLSDGTTYYTKIAAVNSCGVGTLSSSQTASASYAVIGNGGFESALSGSLVYGNWLPVADGDAYSIAERYASNLMSGSYVGRLFANTDAVADKSAYFRQKMTVSAVTAAPTRSITIRPLNVGDVIYNYAMVSIAVYDSGVNQINDNTDGMALLHLFGGQFGANEDMTTLSIGSNPTIDQNYTKTFNLVAWLNGTSPFSVSRWLPGKSMADADRIDIFIELYSNNNASDHIEMYVDSVQ